MRQLFDYQKAGVNFLASNRYAGLFDEPGLGKTTQAIHAVKEMNASTVLVVCPASVSMVWAQEFRDWASRPVNILDGSNTEPKKGAVNVCSYNYLTQEVFVLRFLRPDLVVVDEGHFCKDPEAERTLAVYGVDGLKPKAGAMHILTGTPMPNHAGELYPYIRALHPDRIMFRGRPMEYEEFLRYFTNRKRGYRGLTVVGSRNLGRLKRLLDGAYLRRLEKDVRGQLPPMRYSTLPVAGSLNRVPKEDREKLERLLDKHDDDLVEALNASSRYLASIRRMTGLAKVDGVLEWLRESEIEKAVLFAQHKDVILGLMSGLEKCVGISGDTSPAEREKAVNDFQSGKADFFVGQLQAAGTGITLTAANTVIFVESSWVPAENEQAAKRIHRIGQEKGCIAYFAAIPGSLDERIQAAVARKTADIAALGL